MVEVGLQGTWMLTTMPTILTTTLTNSLLPLLKWPLCRPKWMEGWSVLLCKISVWTFITLKFLHKTNIQLSLTKIELIGAISKLTTHEIVHTICKEVEFGHTRFATLKLVSTMLGIGNHIIWLLKLDKAHTKEAIINTTFMITLTRAFTVKICKTNWRFAE